MLNLLISHNWQLYILQLDIFTIFGYAKISNQVYKLTTIMFMIIKLINQPLGDR